MCLTDLRLKSTSEELLLTQQSLRSKEDLMLDLENKIEESTKTYEKKSEWENERLLTSTQNISNQGDVSKPVVLS